jgi:D-alanyl-D-alanine carboxypeptidase
VSQCDRARGFIPAMGGFRIPTMMTGRRLVVLVVLVIAASGCSGGDAERPARVSRPDLQRTLEYVHSEGAPGVVALVRNASGTWRGAVGNAVLEPRRAMRPGDRFRIASVTKTFVAAVVLQLVDEGRLELDDTVQQRLFGVLERGRDITVRQLLNHTSGLWNFTDDDRFVARMRRDIDFVVTPRAAVAIADSRPLDFEPGTNWAYSNTGYQLLGLIVERTTGKPLPRVLAERIFEPLRLSKTSFEPSPGLPDGVAHGYSLADGEFPLTGNRPRDVTTSVGGGAWAAGAIVSTVDDVARFYRALLGGRLLSRRSLRELQRTVPADSSTRFGLGIFRIRVLCGYAWGHSGGLPGYLTHVRANKDGSHVVVIASNGEGRHVASALEATANTAYCTS